MRVLVVGSGAREHAIVLALAQDPEVTALACAPGNAGTVSVAEYRGVDASDPVAVAALAVDWNAYVASTPGALGTPFAGGETVWAQAWFRDPGAPKTTNLSDALRFDVCP